MLARLALRIAAIQALAPHGARSFPTCAGRHVYDSRVDPIDSLDQIETQRPMLIVYAEEQDDTSFGSGHSHPDRAVITLSIEAIVATRGEIEVEGADGKTSMIGVLEAPVTDAQREATLDLLEAQVRRVLDSRVMVASAEALHKIVLGVESIESVPFRDAANGVRLAQRSIRFKLRCKIDEWPDPNTLAGEGFAALPEPLRSVAADLPAGSPHRAIVWQIAGLAPTPPQIAMLDGVDIKAALGRMPTDEDFDVAAHAP